MCKLKMNLTSTHHNVYHIFMSDNFFDNLKRDCVNAQKRYYNNASVENYNDVRRCVKQLAQMLLLEKAASGSTAAIIELEKSYRYTIPFQKGVEDVTIDDLQAHVLKYSLKTNVHLNELTAASVSDAYINGQISLAECTQLMTLVEKARRADDNVLNNNLICAKLDVPENGKIRRLTHDDTLVND